VPRRVIAEGAGFRRNESRDSPRVSRDDGATISSVSMSPPSHSEGNPADAEAAKLLLTEDLVECAPDGGYVTTLERQKIRYRRQAASGERLTDCLNG